VLVTISKNNQNMNWFYFGLAFNLVAVTTFTFLIRFGGLAISTSVVLLLTILINVLFGYLLFQEKIEPLQWIGIGLGLIAVILISNLYKVFL
jgi:drug/metabolite transporter (DMT)-like permease